MISMEQKPTTERKTLAVLEKKRNNWQIEVCELSGGTFSIREWGPNGEMGRGVNLGPDGQLALKMFMQNYAVSTPSPAPSPTPAQPSSNVTEKPQSVQSPSRPSSNVFNSVQTNTGAPNTSAILDMLKRI